MTMNRIPVASVVMPVYGTERFIQESMDSILNQSFADFELIIICDLPSEDLKNILNSYKQKDGRIKLIYRNERGLISALNTGCEFAKGKYIIRMDADDICSKDRFLKQINYMEQHSEIGVLGSYIELINEKGELRGKRIPPTDPKIIKYELFFECCIAHPSVIMRRNVVGSVGFYSYDSYRDEDTDLWIKVYQISLIANFPEILLKYRIHDANITCEISPKSDQVRLKNTFSLFTTLMGKKFSETEKDAILCWIKKMPISNKNAMIFLYELIIQLYLNYKQKTILNKSQLKAIKKFTGLKLFEIAILYREIDTTSIRILIRAIRFNHVDVIILFFKIIISVVYKNFYKMLSSCRGFCTILKN